MPRQQFVDTCDFVIGDSGQRVGQPSLRIGPVEFGGLD